MIYPVPLLTFSDTAGLDQARFCTFRLGQSWFKRLEEKEVILIGTKDFVLGEAKVMGRVLGTAGDVLKDYAHYSHIELALHVKEGRAYRAKDAPARRFQSIQRLYGPQRFDCTSKLTMIMLQRV